MNNKRIWISIAILLVVIFGGILRLYIIEHDLPSMLPYDFRCSMSTNGIMSFHQAERWWMDHLLLNDALFQVPSVAPEAVYRQGPFAYLMFKAAKKIGQIFHLVTFLPEKYLYMFHPEELVSALLFFRTFNLILALVTLYLTFLLGKKLYNYKIGLLATFMLSIAPGHILYSKFVHSDMPALFWILLSMIFLFHLAESGKLKWYVLGGITLSLAFHSKSYAAPLFLLLPLAHTLFCYEKRIRFRDIILNRNLGIGLISIGLSWIISMPYLWLDPKHFHTFMGAKGWKLFLKTDKLLPSLGFFLKKYSCYFKWLKYEAGYPVFYLGLLGVLPALVRRRKADILLLFYGYLFLVALEFTRHIGYEAHGNYLTPMLPVLAILASWVAISLWDVLSKIKPSYRIFSYLWQSLKVGFLLIFVGLMLFQLVHALAYVDWNSQPDPRRQVADWIDKNLPTGATLGDVSIQQLALEHQLINRFKYNWTDFRQNVRVRKVPVPYKDDTANYFMGIDSKYVILPWNAIKYPPTYKYLLRPGPEGYRQIKNFELKHHFFWSNFFFGLISDYIWHQKPYFLPCVEVLEKRGKEISRSNIYNDLYHYFQKDQSIFRIFLYPKCPPEGYERYIIERRGDRWFDIYQIKSIRKLFYSLSIKDFADLMNVKYLVFSSPVEIPGLHFEKRIANRDQIAYIYRNLDFSPRAYDLLNRGNDNIRIKEYSTDKIRIALDIEQPGLLLINEPPSPYWTVYLNGKRGRGLKTDLPFFIVPFNRNTTVVELGFKTSRFGKAKARLLFVGTILLIAASNIFLRRRTG